MIEELIKKMAKARTPEELMAYKPEVEKAHGDLYKELADNGHGMLHYHVIKNFHAINPTMFAIYGYNFHIRSEIPFLKRYSPCAIETIEFIATFYSLQILELLETGYFKKMLLCVGEAMIETVDIVDCHLVGGLFAFLWYYFAKMLNLKDGENKIEIFYDIRMEPDYFWVRRERYEEVIEMTLQNFADSTYRKIVKGMFDEFDRITRVRYIYEYQPLFVEIAYDYLKVLAWITREGEEWL